MSQTDIQPVPMSPPSKTRPVLFGLLILVSGVIIGAAATAIIISNKPPKFPPSPEYMSRRMLDHLMRELNLTPQQQEALHPIVIKHLEAIDTYREEVRPMIREELESMNAEILHMLDPAQKQIWNERVRRMQENFSRPRHGPGQVPGDRRPDEPAGTSGQQPPRFRDRIPGQTPPPPQEHRPPDNPPPPPQEPILPPAHD